MPDFNQSALVAVSNRGAISAFEPRSRSRSNSSAELSDNAASRTHTIKTDKKSDEFEIDMDVEGAGEVGHTMSNEPLRSNGSLRSHESVALDDLLESLRISNRPRSGVQEGDPGYDADANSDSEDELNHDSDEENQSHQLPLGLPVRNVPARQSAALENAVLENVTLDRRIPVPSSFFPREKSLLRELYTSRNASENRLRLALTPIPGAVPQVSPEKKLPDKMEDAVAQNGAHSNLLQENRGNQGEKKRSLDEVSDESGQNVVIKDLLERNAKRQRANSSFGGFSSGFSSKFSMFGGAAPLGSQVCSDAVTSQVMQLQEGPRTSMALAPSKPTSLKAARKRLFGDDDINIDEGQGSTVDRGTSLQEKRPRR